MLSGAAFAAAVAFALVAVAPTSVVAYNNGVGLKPALVCRSRARMCGGEEQVTLFCQIFAARTHTHTHLALTSRLYNHWLLSVVLLGLPDRVGTPGAL